MIHWLDADDPVIVLQRRQSECCHGCRFSDQDRTPGFEKFTCRKGMRKAVTDLYESERCARYAVKAVEQINQTQSVNKE